jgi:hypothetical protein
MRRHLSVGRRTMTIKNVRVGKDFINKHGPKRYARYTIDERPYLEDGQSVVDLPEVSNSFRRRIDKPVEDVANKVTSSQFLAISAVAWQYEPGLSKEERLAKLDPAIVKSTGDYPTK